MRARAPHYLQLEVMDKNTAERGSSISQTGAAQEDWSLLQSLYYSLERNLRILIASGCSTEIHKERRNNSQNRSMSLETILRMICTCSRLLTIQADLNSARLYCPHRHEWTAFAPCTTELKPTKSYCLLFVDSEDFLSLQNYRTLLMLLHAISTMQSWILSMQATTLHMIKCTKSRAKSMTTKRRRGTWRGWTDTIQDTRSIHSCRTRRDNNERMSILYQTDKFICFGLHSLVIMIKSETRTSRGSKMGQCLALLIRSE